MPESGWPGGVWGEGGTVHDGLPEANSTMSKPAPQRTRRRKSWARWIIESLIALAIFGAIGLLIAEAALRALVGDPPLYVLDERIEYLYKPSSVYKRFGNLVKINQWSMRADDFPQHKSDERELRVLLMGDSILAGGVRVGQRDLAATQIAPALSRITQRPVVVGNASAGSWGPPNLLAYTDKFGFFDADIVVLVLNSNDYDDVPGLEPIGNQWPTHKPALAVQEVLQAYGPRLLAKAGLWTPSPAPARVATHEQDIAEALGALRTLIDRAHASGAKVILVQFLKQNELRAGAEPGFAEIRRIAAEATPPVRLLDNSGAFSENGVPRESLFLPGDNVHPSAAGQRALGALILNGIVQELGLDSPAAAPASAEPPAPQGQ